MQYALATGNTYPNRRDLRAMGGVFDYDESGYWLPESVADKAAALPGITIELVKRDTDPCRHLTPDELRAQRQSRIDRKRASLIDRADRAERRSDEAWSKISTQERDFLRLGEPVKIGHHSERRHRKLIERVDRAFEEAGREAKYADDLRRRADWMMDARVKGDKERAREAKRAAILATIGIGDRVSDPTFGVGVLVKINKKTASMRSDTGNVYSVPIHWLTLIEKGNPESAKVRTERRFQVGELAHWRGPIGGWTTPLVVKVTRRTTRGYSITCDEYGQGRTIAVHENDIAKIRPVAIPANHH